MGEVILMNRILVSKVAPLLAILPMLMASKCIDYDAAVYETTAEPSDSVVDASDTDPSEVGEFVPALECPTQGEAVIDVADFYFAIVCGCQEEPWTDFTFGGSKQCTIPVGTTIRWRFTGSEDHNVIASHSDMFGSLDRTAGEFTHYFDTPGEFTYSCSLHDEMNGYTVYVQ
jgi:hypothetical protein